MAYLNESASAASKETSFTRLQEALGNLRVANSNLAGLAIALVGDEPTAEPNALKSVPFTGDGALGEVGKAANELAEISERMERQIRRIQSRL